MSPKSTILPLLLFVFLFPPALVAQFTSSFSLSAGPEFTAYYKEIPLSKPDSRNRHFSMGYRTTATWYFSDNDHISGLLGVQYARHDFAVTYHYERFPTDDNNHLTTRELFMRSKEHEISILIGTLTQNMRRKTSGYFRWAIRLGISVGGQEQRKETFHYQYDPPRVYNDPGFTGGIRLGIPLSAGVGWTTGRYQGRLGLFTDNVLGTSGPRTFVRGITGLEFELDLFRTPKKD